VDVVEAYPQTKRSTVTWQVAFASASPSLVLVVIVEGRCEYVCVFIFHGFYYSYIQQRGRVGREERFVDRFKSRRYSPQSGKRSKRARVYNDRAQRRHEARGYTMIHDPYPPLRGLGAAVRERVLFVC